MENVNWDEAKAFVKLVNEKVNKDAQEAGWEYRLPTEQQWEYACRGGPMTGKADSAFDFYFEKPAHDDVQGSSQFPGKRLEAAAQGGFVSTESVGLYDMHGNVREWCEDHTNPKKGWLVANRGGGWDAEPGKLRLGVPSRGHVA